MTLHLVTHAMAESCEDYQLAAVFVPVAVALDIWHRDSIWGLPPNWRGNHFHNHDNGNCGGGLFG